MAVIHDVREVCGISFGLFRADELKRFSVCHITSSKLAGEGSIYDERLGVMTVNKQCVTCGETFEKCPGHFGHIELNDIIIHPLYYRNVINFLKCICFNCARVIVSFDHLVLYGINKWVGEKRFLAILDRVNRIDCCCHCNESVPNVTYCLVDNVIHVSHGKEKIIMRDVRVKEIFDRVPDAEVQLLGFNPKQMHPSSLVLTCLPVLPTRSRPFIIQGGNVGDDDLTIQYQEIIKANNYLAQSDVLLSEKKRVKYIQNLRFRIKTLFNNSKGKAKHSSGREIKGLKERISGKEGIIRCNLLGKRVNQSARCLCPDTLILMWDGTIKRAGAVVVGDELIGDDGNPSSVLYVCSGEDDMYKVKQNNGDSYVVTGDHQLVLNHPESSKRHEPSIMTKVKELFSRYKSKQTSYHSVTVVPSELTYTPILPGNDSTLNMTVKEYLQLDAQAKSLLKGVKATRVQWSGQGVRLDPYVLGLWLGGHTTAEEHMSLSSDRSQFIAVNDKIVVEWKKWAEQNHAEVVASSFSNLFNVHRCDYGDELVQSPLERMLSYYYEGKDREKYIPKDYLVNDKDTRLQLLAGYIDASVKGMDSLWAVSFSVSKSIACSLGILCRSLGIQCETTCIGARHLVRLYGNGLGLIPVRHCGVKRKNKGDAEYLVTGISVRYIGKGCYCGFGIDNQTKRFLLADMTVTHNSVAGPECNLSIEEIGVPKETAQILTVPVVVNDTNKEKLELLIEQKKANYIIQKEKGVRINLKYASANKGIPLGWGDKVVRDGEYIDPALLTKFELREGDLVIKTNGDVLDSGITSQNSNTRIQLRPGDVVARHVVDGDILLVNRQPTLHFGSMIAMKAKILPSKTFRISLACTKSLNADFDGDELNIHCPQNTLSIAELQELNSIKTHLISSQASVPNITVVQDTLLGIHLLTKYTLPIPKARFFQLAMSLTSYAHILEKIEHIKTITDYLQCQVTDGHRLFSLTLPSLFSYKQDQLPNGNGRAKGTDQLWIYKGVLVEGVLDKKLINGRGGLIQTLTNEFGSEISIDFINNIQYLAIGFLEYTGFSIGIKDCLPTMKSAVQGNTMKCLLEANSVSHRITHKRIRENMTCMALNNARDGGMKIVKDNMTGAKGTTKDTNSFVDTIESGSKGDYFNITQISSLVGQQTINGERIKKCLNNGKRVLPHYQMEIDDLDIEAKYESQGFISHSFIEGITPREFFFHCISGREGVINTSTMTASSGYIQRKMSKLMEDIQVRYDGTVRNTSEHIIQWVYGDSGFDRTKTIVKQKTNQITDIDRLVHRLNSQYD